MNFHFGEMKIMRILVTGGAGYIGSMLVPKILGQGHEVTVIDNFSYKQNSLLDLCYHPNFEIIRGDVRDLGLMKKLLIKSDFIIPLACLTGAPRCEQDPQSAQSINFESIAWLLKNRSREQKIIFPTTNSGYGVGEKDIYCDEKSPLRPISLYGRLKVQIEEEILSQGDAITFRFATVFGASPRMRLDLLVNDFVYRAFKDRFIVLFEGSFKRNYLSIHDATDAFLFAMENFDKMKNEAFNVGLDDANLSKIELCQLIQNIIPQFYFTESSVGKDPDQRNYIISNKKIARLGFKAKIPLSAGINELLRAYQIVQKNEHTNLV